MFSQVLHSTKIDTFPEWFHGFLNTDDDKIEDNCMENAIYLWETKTVRNKDQCWVNTDVTLCTAYVWLTFLQTDYCWCKSTSTTSRQCRDSLLYFELQNHLLINNQSWYFCMCFLFYETPPYINSVSTKQGINHGFPFALPVYAHGFSWFCILETNTFQFNMDINY